ncbi:CHASE2 domain-containing protein [Sneathiella chungangensis]|nr:CHASE2 domain-containing protein [Sneathiella chungangensis]
MSQAMIVLGICAALIVAFVNLRDKPIVQLIEGQLLDWRFILRGPVPVDRNIELILIEDSDAIAGEGTTVSAAKLIDGVEALAKLGARTIVLDPRLVRMSAPGAKQSDPTQDIDLAKALNEVGNVMVPYVFSLTPSAGGRTALPSAIQRTAYSEFRTRDTSSVKRPVEAGGYFAPGAELLAAGQPGHVTYSVRHSRSRQFAYPVIGYGGSYYPSLAIEAYRHSADMRIADIEVNFGEGISIGSLYIPTDSKMRLAVNYHGPGGSYKRTRFTDLLAGELPEDNFKGKLVLMGFAASVTDGAFTTPFDPAMSEVEFLANVIDNLGRANPLIRSQQVIVLDILLLALIGLFFALVSAARRNWAVVTLAIIATALLVVGNVQAFVLFNLWLGLTFPLMAMVICTLVLVATKQISRRRRLALKAAEEAEETQFSAPWTFDRVARKVEPEMAETAAAEEESEDEAGEPKPEDEVLTLTAVQEEIAGMPDFQAEPEKSGESDESDGEAEEMVEGAAAEEETPASPAPPSNVAPFKPAANPAPGPGALPVPPKPAVKEPPVQAVTPPPTEKQETPATAQKHKKPASLIPVLEPAPRREKVALTSVAGPALGARSANKYDVAVLFLNMSGFRAAAKGFGPTRAVQFLHSLYQLIEKTITAHGGFLEQFGDDDVMGLFGLPEGDSQDAESCVRAARDLAKALADWAAQQDFPAGKTVDFCIAADFGPVRVHAGGDDDNPDISLSGYTIGLASRLDKSVAAKGADVVISEALMSKVQETDLTGELKEGFTEQPMQQVPGAAELVGIWRAEIGAGPGK